MSRINKAYWKETLEVYIFMFFLGSLFFGAIFLSGYLTGTNWLSYIPEFSWDMFNVDKLKNIVR